MHGARHRVPVTCALSLLQCCSLYSAVDHTKEQSCRVCVCVAASGSKGGHKDRSPAPETTPQPPPTWHVELWDELLDVCGGCGGTLPAVPQAVEQAVGRVKLATLQVHTDSAPGADVHTPAHQAGTYHTAGTARHVCVHNPCGCVRLWGAKPQSTQVHTAEARGKTQQQQQQQPGLEPLSQGTRHHNYRTRDQPPQV